MSREPDQLFPSDARFTTRTDGTCDIGDCPDCQCQAVARPPCAHCTDHWSDTDSS